MFGAISEVTDSEILRFAQTPTVKSMVGQKKVPPSGIFIFH